MENLYEAVIKKAITKTKNNTLLWSCLSSHRELYKPPSPQNNIFSVEPLIQKTIIFKESFFAPFNNGYIFLISKHEPSPLDLMNPPILSFEIQEDTHTKELFNTYSSSTKICSELKRLYNLVENSCSDLNSFLNDFLNS